MQTARVRPMGGDKEHRTGCLAPCSIGVYAGCRELEEGRRCKCGIRNRRRPQASTHDTVVGFDWTKSRILTQDFGELIYIGINHALIRPASAPPYKSIGKKTVGNAGAWLKSLVVVYEELLRPMVCIPPDSIVCR